MKRWALRVGWATAALIAWWIPPPDALLEGGDAGSRWAAAGAAGALSGLVCLVAARPGWRRPGWWVAAAVVLSGVGVGLFAALDRVDSACSVGYAGQVVVGGTELTSEAAAYLAANPGLTREGLLFDAAGEREKVWTRDSIARCYLGMRLLHLAWPALLCVGFLMAAQAVAGAPWWKPAAATGVKEGEPLRVIYDAFLSYRHGEPDSGWARWLLGELESAGFRLAIDERDFAPQHSFVTEMERCVRQSRFTLAIVSRRYFESGNAEEEAVIAKVLDMGDRKKRLIPLVMERVGCRCGCMG
jgi:hypothetical protein